MSYNSASGSSFSSRETDDLNLFGRMIRGIFRAFDNVRLATVSVIISALVALLLVVGVGAVGVTLGSVSTIAAVWRDFDNGLGRRIDLFASLRGDLGYGGLIQHWDEWKAGDDAARPKLMEDIQHLTALQPAWIGAHPDAKEQQSLASIMETVGAYERALSAGKRDAVIDGSKIDAALSQIADDLHEQRQSGAEKVQNAVWKLGSTVGSVMILSAAFLVFLALFYLWFTRFRVVSPIRLFMGAMLRLAEGNKAIEIPFVAKKDEIGSMARTVETFRKNMIHADELESEKRAADQAVIRQGERRAGLTDAFGTSADKLLHVVDMAVAKVHDAASNVRVLAEKTDRETGAVTGTAQQATSNVRDVAAATEQLNASIQEISRRVVESTGITRHAVDGITALDSTMSELSIATQKIGEIVSLIGEIASQTNLLALNASIEAQRAGVVGKGFAVVANEVKILAAQTGKATQEIHDQIEQIQQRTEAAVVSLKEVEETVVKADEVVSSIASAIEEQNAVTQGITRNIGEAAKSNNAVTESMMRLADHASEVGTTAAQMGAVIDELGREASTMQSVVREFLTEVRKN